MTLSGRRHTHSNRAGRRSHRPRHRAMRLAAIHRRRPIAGVDGISRTHSRIVARSVSTRVDSRELGDCDASEQRAACASGLQRLCRRTACASSAASRCSISTILDVSDPVRTHVNHGRKRSPVPRGFEHASTSSRYAPRSSRHCTGKRRAPRQPNAAHGATRRHPRWTLQAHRRNSRHAGHDRRLRHAASSAIEFNLWSHRR